MTFIIISRLVKFHLPRYLIREQKKVVSGVTGCHAAHAAPSHWVAGLQELFENMNIPLAHGVTFALSPRG